MTIATGSWWVNRRTGQKLTVQNRRVFAVRGIDKERSPCLLEGRGLFPVWLTAEELRGGWQVFRTKAKAKAEAYVPSWMEEEDLRDVFYSFAGEAEPHRLSIQKVHNGWVCATGYDEPVVKDSLEVNNFVWGLQRYTTLFLPITEATSVFKPIFRSPSRMDRLLGVELVDDSSE